MFGRCLTDQDCGEIAARLVAVHTLHGEPRRHKTQFPGGIEALVSRGSLC